MLRWSLPRGCQRKSQTERWQKGRMRRIKSDYESSQQLLFLLLLCRPLRLFWRSRKSTFFIWRCSQPSGVPLPLSPLVSQHYKSPPSVLFFPIIWSLPPCILSRPMQVAVCVDTVCTHAFSSPLRKETEGVDHSLDSFSPPHTHTHLEVYCSHNTLSRKRGKKSGTLSCPNLEERMQTWRRPVCRRGMGMDKLQPAAWTWWRTGEKEF